MEILKFKKINKQDFSTSLKSSYILLTILWSLGILGFFFLLKSWVECIPVRAFSPYSVFSVRLFFISPSPHFCCSFPVLNTFYSLPLYCFKSAHLVSFASISLSPTHHASIPSLYTPKSSSSLSVFETGLFFPLCIKTQAFSSVDFL